MADVPENTWLTGTKRRLYTLSVLFALSLVAIQTWRRGMDTNVANILIFTIGSTAAGYIGGRLAEAQERKVGS